MCRSHTEGECVLQMKFCTFIFRLSWRKQIYQSLWHPLRLWLSLCSLCVYFNVIYQILLLNFILIRWGWYKYMDQFHQKQFELSTAIAILYKSLLLNQNSWKSDRSKVLNIESHKLSQRENKQTRINREQSSSTKIFIKQYNLER